jgi:hypothetical protein
VPDFVGLFVTDGVGVFVAVGLGVADSVAVFDDEPEFEATDDCERLNCGLLDNTLVEENDWSLLTLPDTVVEGGVLGLADTVLFAELLALLLGDDIGLGIGLRQPVKLARIVGLLDRDALALATLLGVSRAVGEGPCVFVWIGEGDTT